MMDNPAGSLQGGRYPSPRYVTQKQDNFDPANSNRWSQAYYVNDTFWTPGSDAPIFLCVGGEGPPIDGSAVVNSVHCNIAVEWLQEKKALMFALEHRYYGCHNMSACPVTEFTGTESLKYLSVDQAIADISGFVDAMNGEYKLKASNKWISWGGSYPGMTAGWARLKLPQKIHASVASSAPVHAKLDMAEYNDHVAFAFTVSDNDVGGSPACRDAIREGHRQIETMFQTPAGVAQVEEAFGEAKGSLATTTAQMNFAGYGAAQFPAQSNDPACQQPGCNIKSICKIMLDTKNGNELARLAALRKVQGASTKLKDNSLPDFWFYQTCTEFGFYQTCEKNSSCMFARIVDVDSQVGPCEQYGISKAQVEENIANTNAKYGGLNPTGPDGKTPGSCVMYPNGEVDPWMTLSVLKAPSAAIPVMMVPGASHHAWTHPSAPTDQESVVSARKMIRKQVEQFLEQDCTETASILV